MNQTQIRFSVVLFVFTVCVSSHGDERLNGFLKKAVDYAQPRAVKIFGASVGRVEGYGTGIIVSDDGMIITGNGVFLNGFNTRVTLSDGRTYRTRVIRKDSNLQLALLKIDAETPDYFKLEEKPEKRAKNSEIFAPAAS